MPIYPVNLPAKRRTGEHLIAVVDETLRVVQITASSAPTQYVESLRKTVGREDVHILALAGNLGHAVRAVQVRLDPYRIGRSWFDERAIEEIRTNSNDGFSGSTIVPQITMWVSMLIREAITMGGIESIDAKRSTRKLSEIPRELYGVAARIRGRMPTPPKPRGRPRKHFQDDTDQCACGDLWPCPALRLPKRRRVEKGNQSSDVFSIALEKPNLAPRPKPPAWALALARGARSTLAADSEPASDQTAASDEPVDRTTIPSDGRR